GDERPPAALLPRRSALERKDAREGRRTRRRRGLPRPRGRRRRAGPRRAHGRRSVLSDLPLADLRVVAVEQYGAGPWGTMQLADLGAEVIKIEDPTVGGDVGRYVHPYQEEEDSLFFEAFNRSKRSVSLDLRHPDARAVFEDLVASVDAVFSNLRGDQPDKLRLRYGDLERVNPRIVCCSLSGFGV